MKPPLRFKTPRRVLVAKLGLDGHDRGVKIIAHALRDAGYEVIYTGLFQTPDMVANSALEEDVKLIAISILSGAHMTLFPKIVRRLRALGAQDIPLIGGGIIGKEEAAQLKKKGVTEVFGPGTSVENIIHFIDSELKK
jgi:methylmalonyl-CoA mutase, C-terminal domain